MDNALVTRKKEIHYLKAFAIVLVVFYHAIMFSGIFWGNLGYICLCIGLEDVHVPLFVLIAGYLCHRQAVGGFYLKKVRRILVPFLFMTCLKLVFSNLVTPEFQHSGSLPSQLSDAFLKGNLYWYCYALLLLFLAAPLFWNSRLTMWLLLAASLGVNIYLRQAEISVTDILQIGGALRILPCFLIGMLTAQYDLPARMRSRRVQYLVLAAALAAGGVCGYYRFGKDVNHSYYIDLVFGLSVMYLLYFLALRIRNAAVDHVLTMLGRYSLQIMLIDGFFRFGLFYLFRLFLPDGMVMILLVTLAVLALACLTCKAVEKIPGLSFLMGLKKI